MNQSQYSLSIKDQTVNVLYFVNHTWSLSCILYFIAIVFVY